MLPQASAERVVPRSTMTPKPVSARPGSMPRIVWGRLVGIAVVVADVFVFIEVGEQFFELLMLVFAQLLFILGNLLEFGVFNYYPPLLEALLDFLQVGDSGVDGYAVL